MPNAPKLAGNATVFGGELTESQQATGEYRWGRAGILERSRPCLFLCGPMRERIVLSAHTCRWRSQRTDTPDVQRRGAGAGSGAGNSCCASASARLQFLAMSGVKR